MRLGRSNFSVCSDGFSRLKTAKAVTTSQILDLLRLFDGQRKADGSALTREAFECDAPAVRDDERLSDRESQPRAHVALARAGFIAAIEPLEHTRLLFGGDAGAMIVH